MCGTASVRHGRRRVAKGNHKGCPYTGRPRTQGLDSRFRGNHGLKVIHYLPISYTATERTSSDQSVQMSPMGPTASRSSGQHSGVLLKP